MIRDIKGWIDGDPGFIDREDGLMSKDVLMEGWGGIDGKGWIDTDNGFIEKDFGV